MQKRKNDTKKERENRNQKFDEHRVARANGGEQTTDALGRQAVQRMLGVRLLDELACAVDIHAAVATNRKQWTVDFRFDAAHPHTVKQ